MRHMVQHRFTIVVTSDLTAKEVLAGLQTRLDGWDVESLEIERQSEVEIESEYVHVKMVISGTEITGLWSRFAHIKVAIEKTMEAADIALPNWQARDAVGALLTAFDEDFYSLRRFIDVKWPMKDGVSDAVVHVSPMAGIGG